MQNQAQKERQTMKSNLSCFHQVVQLIPRGFIERISREYREERSRDGDGKAVVPRVFGYFDQTVMLMLGHFLRVFSLNELDHPPTEPPVHGLGEAPQTEGRCEGACLVEPGEPAAHLRRPRKRAGARFH